LSLTRHTSIEEIEHKQIRFDPRVWVYEFQRPQDEKIWFTASELERFKYEAISRIQRWNYKGADTMDILPSGTGRIVSVVGRRGTGGSSAMRALFSNPALSSDFEDDDEVITGNKDCSASKCAHSVNENKLKEAMLSEIQSILLVDPHDIFLGLLTKGIRSMLPHAKISSAHNCDEAWKQIKIARSKTPLSDGGCTHGFDIIIVEERLTPFLYQNRREKMLYDSGKPPKEELGTHLIRSIRSEEAVMERNSRVWSEGKGSALQVRSFWMQAEWFYNFPCNFPNAFVLFFLF